MTHRHPFLRRWLAAGLVLLSAAALAAGPKAYVGNFQDNSVSVIDLDEARVIATVAVAAGPDGILVSRDGRAAFVSGSGATMLSVIDTDNSRVVQTIEVGRGPQGLALTPDGRSLLVAVNGEDRVALVDVATRSIVATLPIGKPHTIAVAPDGRRAYVTSQVPGHFALVVVDLGTRTLLAPVPLEKPPRDLEFGRDGRALYFTMAGVPAVQVLDPATDRVVAQIPTGVSPHIANVFANAAEGAIVVQGPGEVQLFDPATNATTRRIAVGAQPHWVDASADGQRLYVTNEGADSVTIVELASGATRSVPVGHGPRKIAVQPVVAAPRAGTAVSIEGFAFQAAEVRIGVGETVEWTNRDGAPHGVAFADGAPGAALMLPGAVYSRRFAAAGNYDYVCSVHPYMTGRVVVQAR